MIFSVKNRSNKPEIMDKYEFKGKKLQSILEDLTTVNKWLGGNNVTLKGVINLLDGAPKEETIKIADIGCGNGTVMREIAKWGRENDYKFQLVGIDSNEQAIKVAQAECIKFPEIDFLNVNVLNPTFEKHKFDIITTTLTLHHFTDEEIVELLNKCIAQSTYGVVINDLERSINAYYLFMAFSAIFLRTKVAIKDGLTSILKGFKKQELINLSKQIKNAKHQIKWFWAFRFQWVIYNNERKDTASN